ncbi:T9SS type B sorting domain-containing protein, partial [Muricauda sp. 2012CJ35-5]
NELTYNVIAINESCLGAGDGIIEISIENGIPPYTIQLNSESGIEIDSNQISLNNLSSGIYNLVVTDSFGCEEESVVEIESENPNLNAQIATTYDCTLGPNGYSIKIILENPELSSEILFALDSSNPNDSQQSPYFNNISEGEHYVSVIHSSGCTETLPFTITGAEPLNLSLESTGLNQITANTTGGAPPYTYYFENEPATSDNVYTINSKGSFTVRVVDSNGCEDIDVISIIDFVDLDIPNFFTPNGDGNNDVWGIKNAHTLDPDILKEIIILIYDRYGREIQGLGPLEQWDGTYPQTNKPLPSGDYWYIVNLNGKKQVDNVTLYR